MNRLLLGVVVMTLSAGVAAADKPGSKSSGNGNHNHGHDKHWHHNHGHHHDHHKHGHHHHGFHVDYHIKFGKSFGHGFYYPGKFHTHWTYHAFWPKYGCYAYWCPFTKSYYYWNEKAFSYYPINTIGSAPPVPVNAPGGLSSGTPPLGVPPLPK
ncbi:MAG TPA: hypothetical protein VKD90_28380 [Gemmataceae bacterium]|nr:hypothetical protein [Gemmataceae bacterium]